MVTITVLATGNNPPKSNTVPSLAALAVTIAVGVVLVAIAIRHVRNRGRPKKPKWQAHGDSMSPWFALGLWSRGAGEDCVRALPGIHPGQAG